MRHRSRRLPLPADAWLVNSRALPVLADAGWTADAVDAIRIGTQIAAVRLREPLSAKALRDGTLSLESLTPIDGVVLSVEGVWLEATWDIIRHLSTQLAQDIPSLAATLETTRLPHGAMDGSAVLGDAPVYVETGAHIEPFTVFDTSGGPVLVRRGATIQSFTRIIGPCYIGRDSIVTTDRIAVSSIGDMCRVHGELSMSVFIGHSNKGHDGFVGHSLLGRWVNLGAGTVTSNLKNTYGTVAMWSPEGLRDTGLQFAGTFFGDHAKTGIGLQLTTGCVLGAGVNVMESMPPKAVAPFSWGTGAPYDVYAREKFIDTAARMMARRQVVLDARQREHLESVIAHALADRRWPSR